MSLEFFHGGLVRVEGIQPAEHHVALDLARVGHAQVVGVGVHHLDCVTDVVRAGAEGERVAERLAHLGLAVDARQTADLRHQRLALDQHFAVDTGVEAADDFVGLFDHRDLVFANRHDGGLESGDVGSLRGRIGQEARRNVAFKTALADFVLDGGVALQPGYRYEVEVVRRQFGQFRHQALDEYGGFGRVDADGQIVERHLQDVVADLDVVAHVVGQGLGVGDQQELAVAVLQGHAVLQRADKVAQVQLAGGAVAGEDDRLVG